MACDLGNVEIAKMLLENGADIDKRGYKGRYDSNFHMHSMISFKYQFTFNFIELH